MSRNVKIAGRKLKNISDPTKAHSHAKGAVVHFMQTAVDAKWGRYLFNQYRRYGLILRKGVKHYDYALKTLKECRQLPVDEKSGFRTLPLNLRDRLEINTMQFLMLTKLGLEYLVTEYEFAVKQIKAHRKEEFSMPTHTNDFNQRLKALAEGIGITSKLPSQIYTIFDRRHIVVHPTNERLWDGSDTGWKTVNLSWALSGEMEGILEPIFKYVNKFVEKIEKYIEDNPIPGEIKISHRGLTAGEHYKKPSIK